MLTPLVANGLRRSQPELAGELFGACGPARLFGPALRDRVVARLRGASLDRELADGADPAECPLLAARAARLSSRANRRRLAETIERFVIAAGLPRARMTIRPGRLAILANRDRLLALASTLRDERPVYVRGVAELMLVLRDGAGPLYVDRHGDALARQLGIVSAGLRG